MIDPRESMRGKRPHITANTRCGRRIYRCELFGLTYPFAGEATTPQEAYTQWCASRDRWIRTMCYYLNLPCSL